jgi:hypothetical protein
MIIFHWFMAGYLFSASIHTFDTDTVLALFILAVSVMNMTLGTIEYKRIRNARR